uniref:C-type mannose receptor 2 n=1 Tax=Latimeria chalumnae TaxID=7897 RepID=H3A816_LATCH
LFPADSSIFLIYSDGMRGCLETRDTLVQLSRVCNHNSPAQQWKWVSRHRLFNIGVMQCLGVSGFNSSTSSPTLNMHACDRESANMRWNCNSLGDQLNQYLNMSSPTPVDRGDQAWSSQWRIHDTNEDLCSRPYHEIYTIQGNSHGRPCSIPFMYNNRWFHDCTTIGREDGHLWCATTVNYGRDERWGFCPIKSSGCETFWDKDPVTKSCYQFNFKATLSWTEARTSCQQQNADLLSITEIHEQTYINGLITGYSSTLWIGLNDLDVNGGWQWSDSSPLKYLNWEAEQPDNFQEENCGVIRTESQGQWQNKDCGIALPYICKKKPNATNPFSTDSLPNTKVKCGADWQQFQSYCYWLNSEKSGWQDARKKCQSISGELISIHTLPELEFAIEVKRDVEELWIGLYDGKQMRNFEWSDGTDVQFTYWHPFEPNNFRNGQEDCVTLWGPEGRWNDGPCNLTLPSICKVQGQKIEDMEEDDHGCKKGWKWHSSSCYWLSEEQLTYDSARRSCSDNGAALVTITNRFEQAYVSSLMYGRYKMYFWTALQDLNRTGTFRWLSGDEVMYTNWNRDQPGYNKGGCMALATGSSIGLWEVKDCGSFKANYICRQNMGTPINPELPSPHPTPSLTGTCPQDWSSSTHLRYCYKVFHFDNVHDKKSWGLARLWCMELGAELISISSFEEEQFVGELLHKSFGQSESESDIHEQHWFWMGLNRRNPGSDSNWKWSDGLAYAYHNFGRGNYDDDDIRQCAVVDLASLQWMAVKCETNLDWICKIPKGKEVKEPEVTQGHTFTGSKEWVRYQDAEYKFFEHHATWAQAQRICTWFQAELVSVHSQAELDFLSQNLQKFSRGQDQHWWIGMHTYEKDGRFRWSDGTVLNFVAWAFGKPRPVTKDKKCVYMTASTEEWSDQKCITDLPYICKKTNITTIKPPLPPPPFPVSGGCPKGWISFIHKCFRIFGWDKSELVTWLESKTACKGQGGMLTTITNHLEQAFITSILPNITFDLWIGLHDANKEFQWLEKEPVKYVNWAPGEPSGRQITASNDPINCAVIWHGAPPHYTGRWDDRSCLEEKHGFICQRNKDSSLPPSPSGFPPSPTSNLSYKNSSYLVLKKPVTWQEALLLCEARNTTLANVPDPYQQAYLTQVINGVQSPLWIGLFNDEGARSFSWLGDEHQVYMNWQDGEPRQATGCVYMDVDGSWGAANCDTKLQGAICKLNTVFPPPPEKWSYSGNCPNSLKDSSWIPFRNHCYTFHMEQQVTLKEAVKKCQKVDAEVLSIMDETENVFVWDHLQTYQSKSWRAWLGMTFNSKEGYLVWPDETAVNYSNWGQYDTNPSMLSPNTCFWVQGNNGAWGLGSCNNATMGIICKLPRVQESSYSKSPVQDNTTVIAVVILTVVAVFVLIALLVYLHKQRTAAGRGPFESARYSRTTSAPNESAEKNILVSDMEMNEQQE